MSHSLPAMDNVQNNARNYNEGPHVPFSNYSCSVISSNYVQNY